MLSCLVLSVSPSPHSNFPICSAPSRVLSPSCISFLSLRAVRPDRFRSRSARAPAVRYVSGKLCNETTTKKIAVSNANFLIMRFRQKRNKKKIETEMQPISQTSAITLMAKRATFPWWLCSNYPSLVAIERHELLREAKTNGN